ncbi:MAG: PPOX class F420-dependent oxidoreductase [Nocardia sp.]|nr:PPOX class F420-dependent oxidoreductase [Nocardia sp.]
MVWNELAQEKYLLLTTFKKDGVAVATPVWVVPDGERILVWTDAKSWKVKRLRRNPTVTLRACDRRGHPTGEQVCDGTGRVLDAAGTERVRDLITGKYGVIGTLVVRGHKLFLGAEKSIGLAITPGHEPA